MGIIKKSVCVILGILIVALSVVICLQNIIEDDTPPEIKFDNNTIKVKIGDDNSKLLAGVKATDNRDGDISEDIIIDSISDFSKDGTRTITYGAVDSSNNVAKKSRKLVFLFHNV